MTTLFEQVGGETIRAVLEDFYERVYADIMIGFLFVGVDKERLIQREWEFTARFLGAEVPYTGRPMVQAHKKHPILGGHFERRFKLLSDVLDAHEVPPEVRSAWLEHTRRLRKSVTKDPGTECNH